MKPNHLLPLALLALVAGGCAVGPNYQRPAVNTPARWSEPLAGGETNAPVSLAGWWKNFNDPELDSLIDRAVQSNLDLHIARARVQEARARYGIAAANLWPSADVSGSYARTGTSHHQPVLGSLPIPPGVPFENDVYQAGFDASWEIDVFGGKRRATEAAGDEVAALGYGGRAALITLLGDVARNYIDVRGYQRQLAITKENIQAQAQALAITHDRFTNGLTSDLDVQQAATLLATTKAEVPTLETSLQASIHRLGVLLGQPPGTLLAELSKTAPIPAAPPQVPVGLPSELLLRRPDVQQAERQLAAATANIGVARADLFPKFYLTGLAGFESVSASDWFTAGRRFWSAGPTVQWKIFDAGRIRANIKVRNARQEQALAAYEKTVLSAFEDVENGLVAYANEQMRRQTLESAVTAWQGLLCKAGVQRGQRVLIHGAAGGVGLFAVQLARWRRAHVIATASAANLDFVRTLGAEQVIDYQTARFEDMVRDVDVVFDAVGGETLERSWRVLKAGGKLVTIATQSAGAIEQRVRDAFLLVRADGSQLRQIAKLIDAGELRVFVEGIFPLARARTAYERAQQGKMRGKIALRVVE